MQQIVDRIAQETHRLKLVAQGAASLVRLVYSTTPHELEVGLPQDGHDHDDQQALQEEALSWGRTLLAAARINGPGDGGFGDRELSMLGQASEELDHCFVTQSGGAVLLIQWLVAGLASLASASRDEAYERLALALALRGVDASGSELS